MNFRVESVFRVGGAMLLGAVLIGAALYVRFDTPGHSLQEAAVGVVARGDVRTVQQTKDGDGDGYPDWEEALRGTDPHTPTTLATTTPTETREPYHAPNTVTGQFSEKFFEDLMRQGAGRTLSPDEQNALLEKAITELSVQTKASLYTRGDISVTAQDDLAAVREYGNAISQILAHNSINNEDEFVILDRALSANDPTLLAPLAPIARAYGGMVADLRAHAVPGTLVSHHLDLINALSMIEADVRAMQTVFDDPLGSLVHIQRYQDDATGLFLALDNIRTALEAQRVVYTDDEPGVFLFSLRP